MRFFFFIPLLTCLLTFKAEAQALAGKEFICGFMENEVNQGSTLIVYLASDRYATVDITIPLQGYAVTVNLVPDTVIDITIPLNLAAHAGSEIIEGKAIFISSSDSILVYLLHRHSATSDGATVFPAEVNANSYYAVTYKGRNIVNSMAEFLILAHDSNTLVTITPTDTTAGGQLPGIPFNVVIHQGQSYQVQAMHDLTGSLINTSKPVALFSGNKLVNMPYDIPFHCCGDHLFEQMLPVNLWGNEYVTAPLMSRDSGDTYRIIAKDDSTIVYLNGVVTDTLNAGKFCEWRIKVASVITANKPVLVTQYANSQNFDGTVGDPFIISLLPAGNWYSKTLFKTYTCFGCNFSYYVNLVTLSTWISTVKVNGSTIPSSSFQIIQGTVYSYTTIQVNGGIHRIESDSGFIAYYYAFDTGYESYGIALPGYGHHIITGISNIKTIWNKIDLWPNPLTENFLKVKLPETLSVSGFTVSITDLSGREVFRVENVRQKSIELLLPELKAGAYLFMLTDAANVIRASSRFIKMNP